MAIFIGLAYVIRPYATTLTNRKYFLPALTIKFLGAIMLGMIYQFYYSGGDTFNYWQYGSRWIWEAFLDDPLLGLQLIFTSGENLPEAYIYTSRIWYFGDSHSYLIVRIAAFFDLFTFHTYGATALFFAVFSFSGLWAMYSALDRKYPNTRWLHLFLFIPTVFFWGSGILKDTITLGALGWLTYACINIIEFRQRNVLQWMIGLLAAYIIFNIKIYILICFIPTIFIWLFLKNSRQIKNVVVRVLVLPLLFLFFGLIGYASLNQIASQSSKYNLDNIAKRAAINAYDIRYGWGARTGGDGGYDLGELDGSWQSMVTKMPMAINVSLFRPYLWEVRNPLMLLSALESSFFLGWTLWLIFWKKTFFTIFKDPFLVFCLAFALLFAFAVGVSTFNFGSLMRYKIPLIPFYMVALVASRKS